MTTKEFNEKYRKIYDELHRLNDGYERGMKSHRKNTLTFRMHESGFNRTWANITLLEQIFTDLRDINRNDS